MEVDMFSKLANAVPMETRDSETVVPAWRKSVQKMGYPLFLFWWWRSIQIDLFEAVRRSK